MISKGTIISFAGTYTSGIAYLVIEEERQGRVSVPCENAPTARALHHCFKDVIAPGHTVDNVNGGHVGAEIYYSVDGLGMLEGFTPTLEAPQELVQAYEGQNDQHPGPKSKARRKGRSPKPAPRFN